jgi:hypothetical protein
MPRSFCGIRFFRADATERCYAKARGRLLNKSPTWQRRIFRIALAHSLHLLPEDDSRFHPPQIAAA